MKTAKMKDLVSAPPPQATEIKVVTVSEHVQLLYARLCSLESRLESLHARMVGRDAVDLDHLGAGYGLTAGLRDAHQILDSAEQRLALVESVLGEWPQILDF